MKKPAWAAHSHHVTYSHLRHAGRALPGGSVALRARGMTAGLFPDGARFFHEARLASQVKHPNTVYVTDFGTLPDGRPYLVMEYLAGRTLDAVHKEGPLAPR